MLDHLNDAIFSFFILDRDRLFAARDLLGIKTLFFGHADGNLLLASELKSVAGVTGDVNEFPPGHFMDENGRLTRYARPADRSPA